MTQRHTRDSWSNLREPCMERSKSKQIWAAVAMVIRLLLSGGLVSSIKMLRARMNVAASSVQIRIILRPFLLRAKAAWKVHKSSRNVIVSRRKIAPN